MPKERRKINYPNRRKSPVRHTVKSHTRQGRPVRSFSRGHGHSQKIIGIKKRKVFVTKYGYMTPEEKRLFDKVYEEWKDSGPENAEHIAINAVLVHRSKQVHPAIQSYDKFKRVPRFNQALKYALLVAGVKEAKIKGVDQPLTENLLLAFHKNGRMKRRVYYGLLEWTSWKSSSLDENERLAANYIRTWAWQNKNRLLQGKLEEIRRI